MGGRHPWRTGALICAKGRKLVSLCVGGWGGRGKGGGEGRGGGGGVEGEGERGKGERGRGKGEGGREASTSSLVAAFLP